MNASDILGDDFNRLCYVATILPKQLNEKCISGVAYRFLSVNADKFVDDCAKRICENYGLELVHCRINEYGSSDFCDNHTDTAYRDCHTISVCLLHSDDSLYVDDILVQEYKGSITIIPKNTIHGVRKGNVRTSLVIWAKTVN